MSLNRCFTNILSEDIDVCATFYEDLFDMRRHFDSEWFVLLTHDDIEGLEFGVLQRDHEVVHEHIRAAPAGVMLTFVVDDCDVVYQRAVDMEADIIETPADQFYGQRRMLLRDPDGTVVDVSAPAGDY